MCKEDLNIESLRNMGFRSRSKRRLVLHTSFNQFVAANIYNDGILLEIDGKLILSKKLSLENVTNIVNLLFLDEKR